MQHRPTVRCKPAVGEEVLKSSWGFAQQKNHQVCRAAGMKIVFFFAVFFGGLKIKVDCIAKND